MSLNTAQRATLKAAILADTNPLVIAALGGGEVGRNDTELARLYNLNSTFVAWRKDTLKSAIFGAITWKNMTPADAPDGTVLQTNRSLACQGKQFVLQTMLISPGETLDMSIQKIRDGVKDSVQNLPAGVNGAEVDAGWATIKIVSTRFVTVAEKLFATGAGTDATPGTPVFEGMIDIADIGGAMNG